MYILDNRFSFWIRLLYQTPQRISCWILSSSLAACQIYYYWWKMSAIYWSWFVIQLLDNQQSGWYVDFTHFFIESDNLGEYFCV